MTGCVNESLNGVPLSKRNEGGGNMDNRKNALVDEVTAAGVILNKLHIPYRVVTDRTGDLSDFRTILVCAAAYLSDEGMRTPPPLCVGGRNADRHGENLSVRSRGPMHGEFPSCGCIRSCLERGDERHGQLSGHRRGIRSSFGPRSPFPAGAGDHGGGARNGCSPAFPLR